MIVKPVVVRGNVFVKDLLLNATDDMHNKPELEFTEGGYFTSQDAFEVISSKVEHLPVNVGDRVTIKPENKEYTFKIVGILNRMTIGLAYIPKGTANKLIQEKVTGFYANTSLSPKKAKELLYADENIAWVQPKSDIKIAVLDFLSQAMVVTKISLWISIGMAMLFLLTGITINIRDREGEYATLGSLGYSERFLTREILLETMIAGLLGLLVSVPFAFLFSKYLNYELGKAMFQMDLYFGTKELFEVMGYAFAFLPIAALPGIRHILTLNIPMAVRRKSFG
jgi:ABC-type lipoprotein release transport system permease subunit